MGVLRSNWTTLWCIHIEVDRVGLQPAILAHWTWSSIIGWITTTRFVMLPSPLSFQDASPLPQILRRRPCGGKRLHDNAWPDMPRPRRFRHVVQPDSGVSETEGFLSEHAVGLSVLWDGSGLVGSFLGRLFVEFPPLSRSRGTGFSATMGDWLGMDFRLSDTARLSGTSNNAADHPLPSSEVSPNGMLGEPPVVEHSVRGQSAARERMACSIIRHPWT